jgi:hypothetical protein
LKIITALGGEFACTPLYIAAKLFSTTKRKTTMSIIGFHNLLLLILVGLSYVHHLFWFGLLNGAGLLAFCAENKTKTKIFCTLYAIVSIIPIAAFLAIPYLASGLNTPDTSSKLFVMLWLGCAVLSWFAAMLWMRYGVQKFRTLTNKVNCYLHPNDQSPDE